MNSLLIQHPGARATIQDLGRIGYRNIGVSPGGAVDKLAAQVANWLVGNADGAAVLECALVGPKLEFSKNTTIAITGAAVDSVPTWQRLEIKAGATLNLSRLRDRNYIYIAVAGGIDVPKVLGSAATDLRVGWGGLDGRALQAGDLIKLNRVVHQFSHADIRVNDRAFYHSNQLIRIVKGCDWRRFSSRWIEQAFQISSQSDRMGIRLTAKKPVKCSHQTTESKPVFPGTIQCPPDGQPIVLLADAQTLGGYPQIGQVISTDMHRIPQFRFGTSVQFEVVSIETTHKLAREQEKQLARLKFALQSA